MPKIKVEKRDPMTQDEVRQMIETATTPRNKALIACLYLVGPRITEALELQRMDIEITDDEVSIKMKPKKRKDEHSPLIYRHTLVFPITAPFMEYFVNWARGIPQEDYLFPGYNPHMFESD